MKRLTAPIAKTVVAFSLLVPVISPWAVTSAHAESAPISVSIDGNIQMYDQPPVMINNRVMVPLRGILERLGAKVEWDGEEQTVQVSKDGETLWTRIGEDRIYLTPKEMEIDQPLVIHNGRTLIPVRLFSELFGANVTWDAEHRVVKIDTNGMKLFEAIKNGDQEYVQQLLQAGVNPNVKAFGDSALYEAFHANSFPVSKALLESGATLSELEFSTAVYNSQIELVRLCLEYWKSRPHVIPLDELVLIDAIQNNRTEAAKVILASGTDPNLKRARSYRGGNQANEYTGAPDSLLFYPIFLYRNLELAEELLKAGADPTVIGSSSFATDTPLSLSALLNHASSIELLLRYDSRIDQQDMRGWTPLMVAAEAGSTDSVKMLLKHQADVNMSNHGGANALMIAEAHGNSEIASLLSAAGATRNKNVVEKSALSRNYTHEAVTEPESFSPLLQAVYYGDNDKVRTLLAKGELDSNEWNKAVLTAFVMFNWETVRTLYDNKTNFDKDMESLLIMAIQAGNMEMVRFALEHNADPDNRYREQPLLSMAATANNIELVQELLDHGASLDYPQSSWNPIREAAEHGHLQMVKLLLSSFTDPDQRAAEASEALLTAVTKQNVPMVQLLLDMGADPNYEIENIPLDTPLEAAKKTGIPQLITVLEKAGATR